MTAVLESHNVATTGADLNHFVRKILNICNLDVLVKRISLVGFIYPAKGTNVLSGNAECCEKLHHDLLSIYFSKPFL